MQLGFVSAILPELSLEDVLICASDLEFDAVEVMCWPPGKADRRYAGVTHIDVSKLDEEGVKEINELSWRHEVKISGLGYYGNPLSPDPAEAETAARQVRSVLEACEKLGVPRMNTFIGRDWTKSVNENFKRFGPVWKPLVQAAEDLGVSLGIENCPMIFTEDEWPGGKNLAASPAIWRRMFSEIPSNHFGLNYDPSHLVWQQMDYLKPIEEFASRIFHVHAKDTHIDPRRLNDVGIMATPAEYSDAKLPGRGDVDWTKFFEALNRINYEGPVCVEVEDRDYEGSLEQRQQALRETCQFLRQFIPQE